MATITPFINALGEDATIYTRTLGARNATTQWPALTWGSGTATKIFVDDIQTRETQTAAGRVTEKIVRGYVPSDAAVVHLDRVVYHGETYEVASVVTTEYLLGDAIYKKIELTRMT